MYITCKKLAFIFWNFDQIKGLRKFESGLNLFQVCGQLSQKSLLGSVVLHDLVERILSLVINGIKIKFKLF
ncbi:hypothetical protein CMV_028157 [Castanea mollissima]|uniref:Uncharacterized protein n=1 Tax=Castanea mollissima TaxID=60419 RepID=A0A8J4Q5H6_9ROSI|nr:hypothetical protein CMV_028157 [Castanea mollissima]